MLFCLPDVKPLVGFFMENVIFVAQFLGSDSFLQCLCLRGCSVFIGTADVQRPPVSGA